MSIDNFYAEKFNTTKAELFYFVDQVKIQPDHWILANGQVAHDPQKYLWELSKEDFLTKFTELFKRAPKKPIDPNVDSLDLETITNCQVVKSKILQYINEKPVYEILDPVYIDNKFIYFYDPTVSAYYKIRVKQKKGAGAGYADELVTLNNEHKEIIKVWLKSENVACTVEQIRYLVNQFRKKLDLNAKIMKPGSAQGRISELLRRGIVKKNKPGSKWSILQKEIAKQSLESGLFPEIK